MKKQSKNFTIKLSLEEIGAISNSEAKTVNDVLKDLLLVTKNDKVKYICNITLGREKETQEIDSEMKDIIDSICYYIRLY